MPLDQELLIRTFRNEAECRLSELERLAIEFAERPEDLSLVQEMARCAHTLKGGAACVGFERVMLHSHELEGLFDAVTAQRRAPNRDLSALALDAVDFLRNGVRVDAERAAEPIQDEQHFLTRILDWIEASGNEDDHSCTKIQGPSARRVLTVEVDRLDDLRELTGELANALGRLRPTERADNSQGVASLWQGVEKLVQSLQENVARLRRVPLCPTLERVWRTVRDQTQAGKAVRFVTEREIEIDVAVADALRDPLQRMLRNAVEYGIKLSGPQPHEACITLGVRRDADEVVIDIQDIDAEQLILRACTLGTNESVRDCTTRDSASSEGSSDSGGLLDLCGRAIGIDAVRRDIEALRGNITLRAVSDRCLAITIRVPLTTAGCKL